MRETGLLRTVIVDDDDDVRFLLRRSLDRSGHFTVVGEAADGEEAVDVAREAAPDVVVMDLNMPRIDGLRALPHVRAVCPRSTAIVVISARPSEAALQAVADGQAAAFLEKSTGFAQLVQDLLAIADRGGRSRDDHTARWQLPAELTSGAVARQQIRDLLASWQLIRVLDEAELLTTELVNNAVLHARSEVLLTVQRRQGAVRVEVTDTGQGSLHRPAAGIGATHGRGLMLVEAMSADWGTAVNGSEKTVWFELAAD